MRLVADVLDVAAAFASPESAEKWPHWEWERAGKRHCRKTHGYCTAQLLFLLVPSLCLTEQRWCLLLSDRLSFRLAFAVANCSLTFSPFGVMSGNLLSTSMQLLRFPIFIALHLFLPCTLFDLCVYAVFFFNTKETEAIYVNNYSIFPKARNECVLSVFSAQKRRLEKWIIATDISNQIWKSCRHATVQT